MVLVERLRRVLFLSIIKGNMAPDLSDSDAYCAAMVAERNLGQFFLDNASNLAIEEEVHKLTHIRLDREKLESLDLCHYFLTLPLLTNLYLQENELKSLKGLEMVKNLKYFIVAGNHLTKLGYLSSLCNLMVLDVSENNIMEINAGMELPKSLSFLNVVGNPCCTQQSGLRNHLKTELPNLKELNGDPLTDDECTSESESLESTFEGDVNDPKKHTNNNNDKLTSIEDQETTHHAPKDQSFNFPSYNCATPPIVQQIGTPSFCKRLTASHTCKESPNLQSLNFPSDVRSKDLEDLVECLLKANSEPEFVVQKVLAMTTGSLDYPTMAIMERVAERAKNFDGQLSQEILDIFLSPSFYFLRPAGEMTEPSLDCESLL